jgi:hypothetical protein
MDRQVGGSIRQRALGTGALGATLASALFLWTASAIASSGPIAEHPVAQSPAEVRDYWTPERMREAKPLELAPAGEGAASAPVASTAAAPPDQEIPAALDMTYPYRIHGRLFLRLGSIDASCSATVVTSFSRDLAMTAGHCVAEPGGGTGQAVWATNVVFVPAYRGTSRPFGLYPATTIGAPVLWVFEGDIAVDVGTVKLAPGPTGLIQDALGSRGVGFNRSAKSYNRKSFQLFGYPAEPPPFYDGERPILCSSPFAGFEKFTGSVTADPCHQQEGASGGGWVLPDGLVNSVTSHSGCVGVNPACTLISGTYFGDTAFKLWSSSGGPLPGGKRKRIKGCRRFDKGKRQRCLSRAETFGPVIR